MTHRRRVVDYWNGHVERWLAGEDPLDDPLPRYFASYAGKGRGQVSREGFVEPYQGDLLGRTHEPRLVVLGLNPGVYVPELQSRSGVFAGEMRRLGSYYDWIVTAPYTGPEWTSRFGRNRYFTDRVAFTGRWLQIDNPVANDMMVFDLYPWHSTAVTAPIQPPADLIDQFVWQPISEIDTSFVFAFGRPWDQAAQALALPLEAKLGAGGSDYGSNVRSRAVRVYALPSGQRLVVEWHSGSAGPPRAHETELLRRALSA